MLATLSWQYSAAPRSARWRGCLEPGPRSCCLSQSDSQTHQVSGCNVQSFHWPPAALDQGQRGPLHWHNSLLSEVCKYFIKFWCVSIMPSNSCHPIYPGESAVTAVKYCVYSSYSFSLLPTNRWLRIALADEPRPLPVLPSLVILDTAATTVLDLSVLHSILTRFNRKTLFRSNKAPITQLWLFLK